MISFILPEAEAEGNINDITRVDGLLSQCTIRNQLPVIKQVVSATIQDLIGYFPENILIVCSERLFRQRQVSLPFGIFGSQSAAKAIN